MPTIIGFDCETANRQAGSICQVGCAIVCGGRVVEAYSSHVRLHDSLDYLSPICFGVHGIPISAIRSAPPFCEIWPRLSEFLLSGDVVAIHNAPFDLRQLSFAAKLHGVDLPQFRYQCTCSLSRRKLPHLASHSLSSVAAHLDIAFRHHDACDDAVAAALVADRLGPDPGLMRNFPPGDSPKT